MPCKPDSLVVGDVTVRQDSNGRYCLNDLHRAAGGAAHHQPAEFMRLLGTKAMVEEIKSGNPQTSPYETVMGRNGGTYVCRTLVFRYAAWVSAAFELKVYKVFEDYVDGRLAPTAPQLPGDYIQALEALVVAEKEKRRLVLESEAQRTQLALQAPKATFFDNYVEASTFYCLREAAKRLWIPPQTFNDALLEKRYCFRRVKDRVIEPYAEFIERGFFAFPITLVATTTPKGVINKDRPQTKVTPAGLAWLGERLAHLSTRRTDLPLLPESTQP
ncbi:putative antirepressor family protein [Myxococcus phage Mx9]|nr:putative antirepressor family protein [Myxococcus phage Mx9]